MMNIYKKGLVITATELKKNLGKYLDMTIDKKDVVIKKNGTKIARLTPYVTDIEAYYTVREESHDYVYGGKKISYEEFMIINGKSTKRLEFINGEIVVLASPSSFHQEMLGVLYISFTQYFKKKPCKVFLAPFDVHFNKKDIKEPDVMQPDITIACDWETTINEKGRYMGTPTLVVEILSPSTRSKDMVDKLNTYMLSGLKEYWVIDRKNHQIIIYSFTACEIDKMQSFQMGDEAKSFCFDGLAVQVDEIFE